MILLTNPKSLLLYYEEIDRSYMLKVSYSMHDLAVLLKGGVEKWFKSSSLAKVIAGASYQGLNNIREIIENLIRVYRC